jgi:hypothetical protein
LPLSPPNPGRISSAMKKTMAPSLDLNRRSLLVALAGVPALVAGRHMPAWAQVGDPLPSWNDGRAKRSILDFVAAVTREGSPDFVLPAERIATFDNDGTLWCEQPMYVQLAFALDRVRALAPQHPEWKGRQPFKGTKGTAYEGGFRAPCIVRWPGKIKPGSVQNGLMSALDWFPTLLAAAGNPNVTDQLLKGVKLGERTYKNHLDGYDQTELLQDKGPSRRREFFYFAGAQLGALRLDDFKFQFIRQPSGWPGGKITTDMPGMVNIRQDPFERTPSINSENLNNLGGGYMNDFYAREFWRFVLVQQKVADLAKTAIDYPPMQDPASFNLEAVKQQIDSAVKNKPGQ